MFSCSVRAEEDSSLSQSGCDDTYSQKRNRIYAGVLVASFITLHKSGQEKQVSAPRQETNAKKEKELKKVTLGANRPGQRSFCTEM